MFSPLMEECLSRYGMLLYVFWVIDLDVVTKDGL